MKGWVKKTIKEICNKGGGVVKTGPFGSQLHESDYQEFGTPVVMPADIIAGKINTRRVARVSESHVERLRKHKLIIGDIVYGRRGDIGRQALIRPENEGWLCGTGCIRLSLGKSVVVPEFLHYYLSTNDIIGWIEGQAIGATMPNLNTSILNRVPIYFPESILTQNKIGSILSMYDGLIENNQRRISLLEKIAEEIFHEWFVRLRFPGHENTKLEKGVPVNWDVDSASKFFGIVKGKSYRGDELTENFEHMPFVTLKSFKRGGGYRKDGLKYYSGRYADNQVVHKNDVVMAVTDMTQERVVVGRVARIPDLGSRGAVISLDLIKLVPKKVNSTFLYSYMHHSGFGDVIKEFANGANVLHLKPDLVSRQKIAIPPIPIQDEFVRIIDPIYRQIDKLSIFNDRLTDVRNMLLPRIISGKLSVEELDIHFSPNMQEGVCAD